MPPRKSTDKKLPKEVIGMDHFLWKVHTPHLISDIVMGLPGAGAVRAPFQIFMNILAELAEHSRSLNDMKLHALMCRLTLYEQSDPCSKDYDPAMVKLVMDAAYPNTDSDIKPTNHVEP